MNLMQDQNPGGHKEDRASFFQANPIQGLKNPYSKSYPREEKGRKRERERGRTGEGRGVRAVQAKKREEREWVRGYLSPLTLD